MSISISADIERIHAMDGSRCTFHRAKGFKTQSDVYYQ